MLSKKCSILVAALVFTAGCGESRTGGGKSQNTVELPPLKAPDNLEQSGAEEEKRATQSAAVAAKREAEVRAHEAVLAEQRERQAQRELQAQREAVEAERRQLQAQREAAEVEQRKLRAHAEWLRKIKVIEIELVAAESALREAERLDEANARWNAEKEREWNEVIKKIGDEGKKSTSVGGFVGTLALSLAAEGMKRESPKKSTYNAAEKRIEVQLLKNKLNTLLSSAP